MPISRTRLRAAVAVALLAAALGFALRFESARHMATGLASSCSFSTRFDCDKVQQSGWSELLGIPLSVWAVVANLTLAGWLLSGRVVLAGIGATAGVLVAGFLAYVSFFRIEAICLYCSGIQLCSLALAILVVPAAVKSRPRPDVRLPALLALLFLGLGVAGESYARNRAGFARLFLPSETVKERVDVAGAPVIGDPASELSGLLFLDFGCPHCRNCYRAVRRLVARDPRYHFFVKHYPLDRCNEHEKRIETHPGACDAAWAAAAAAQRGKGADAAAFLFEQDSYYPQVLNRMASMVGGPIAEWKASRQSDEVKRLVQRDMDDAHRLKINGVPRAYVNGRPRDCQGLAK
ncbi:MAG: vitamin K epoxide reductase family protein [Planctomycetota bacterium]|jgi:uncharacterized membrane protein